MTGNHAAQWAEARRLYEAGGAPKRIARDTGFPETTLRDRAKREGWQRLDGSDGARAVTAARSPPDPAAARPARARSTASATATAAAPKPTRTMRKALIRRLYNAIDLKLRHWEERMATGSKLSAADSERMAKEVTTMISGFERVAETEGAIEKRDAQSTTAAPAGGRRGGGRRRGKLDAAAAGHAESDAERMRREIAARLERLQVGGIEDGSAG